jgi:putative hemolysin
MMRAYLAAEVLTCAKPRSLGNLQAERVSRVMVPIINFLALLVYPIGKLMELTSKTMLSVMGIKESDDSNVSEEELRMIVMGAKIRWVSS